MKTNQQEEMEKEFEKFWNSNYDKCGKYTSKEDALKLFEAAYTLQQEKIEKLEKVIQDQEKERQSAEAFWKRRLEIHQREIDSLKSDLTEATSEAILWLENVETEGCCSGQMCGCLGKPTNREYYDLQRMKEIRLRHNLDKSEEV